MPGCAFGFLLQPTDPQQPPPFNNHPPRTPPPPPPPDLTCHLTHRPARLSTSRNWVSCAPSESPQLYQTRLLSVPPCCSPRERLWPRAWLRDPGKSWLLPTFRYSGFERASGHTSSERKLTTTGVSLDSVFVVSSKGRLSGTRPRHHTRRSVSYSRQRRSPGTPVSLLSCSWNILLLRTRESYSRPTITVS